MVNRYGIKDGFGKWWFVEQDVVWGYYDQKTQHDLAVISGLRNHRNQAEIAFDKNTEIGQFRGMDVLAKHGNIIDVKEIIVFQ